jgi:hypothetical protein
MSSPQMSFRRHPYDQAEPEDDDTAKITNFKLAQWFCSQNWLNTANAVNAAFQFAEIGITGE